MINLNECSQSQLEFDLRLQRINEAFQYYSVGEEVLCEISTFIEDNKNLLVGNTQAAIILSSMSAKVCKGETTDPLNLKKHITRLLPSNPELVKVTLQFFRNSISNPSELYQSIAGWINIMKIPLASLDLSEKELAGLLVRLDYVDLTNYNFELHDLKLFTEILLNQGLKFKISDNSVLGIIARICAKYNSLYTPRFIKNFRISDPEIRTEIAYLCAKENAQYTGHHIKNFQIVDPLARMEMARLFIKDNGNAKHLKDFAIEDPADRIEIARLCAEQDPWNAAYNFKDFKIEDSEIRTEIAHLCATGQGRVTACHFKNFEILNIHDRLEVLYQCVKFDPVSLFSLENFSPLPDELIKFPKLIQVLNSKEKEESLRGELFNEIDQLIKLTLPETCQHILIRTSQEVRTLPPHTQNLVGLWLLASILTMRSLKRQDVEWMIDQGIWRELALLRDPSLRVILSRGLYELSSNEFKREPWEDFLSSVRGEEGQKGLMLLAIPFFALQNAGIEEKRLIEMATTLAGYQNKKSSQLRSVYYIKNLLHVLHAVCSNDAYNPEIKRVAFEKIFIASDEKTLIKNIIATKGLLHLKDPDWPTSSEDVNAIFHHSLEKVIPLQNCQENVTEKYDEIFASCRNPDGLMTYAAGLKTLDEPEVMNCLGDYVVSVLDGTFKEERYKTERNPHLAKIVKFNPNLLKIWKEDLLYDLDTLTSSGGTPAIFNPAEWLEVKLITDRHLGKTELSFVTRYFDKDADKKGVFQDLIAQINICRKEKEIAQLREKIDDFKKKNLSTTDFKKALKSLSKQASENPELAKLTLQKACLNFIQKGQGAEKNVLIELLTEIDRALKQAPQAILASEFAKDVKGLIESFEELKSKDTCKEGLKVLFTDDPIDLLLCGTDVSGSCQRLDGYPNLNKGLLGYLIDGKNRLLAIKEGDKMIARSMLRLLWDGKQPVIYRERFYPDTTPTHYQNALNALAKEIATKLGLPLTSNDAGTPYGKKLKALGGPAPYEYSDGAEGEGVYKNGFYTILEAKHIV